MYTVHCTVHAFIGTCIIQTCQTSLTNNTYNVSVPPSPNPVTRVSNGGVGVLVSQRQETSHLSRLQCNVLAETLVLIPAVTAMLFPAHPRPLITATDILAMSKHSAKLSTLRATQHLTPTPSL